MTRQAPLSRPASKVSWSDTAVGVAHVLGGGDLVDPRRVGHRYWTLVAVTVMAGVRGPLSAERSALHLQEPEEISVIVYRRLAGLPSAVVSSSLGVVRRDWKYIEWPEFGFRQLFDLHRDPGEIHNLAGQPSHAGRQLRMRQGLEEWRRRAR